MRVCLPSKPNICTKPCDCQHKANCACNHTKLSGSDTRLCHCQSDLRRGPRAFGRMRLSHPSENPQQAGDGKLSYPVGSTFATYVTTECRHLSADEDFTSISLDPVDYCLWHRAMQSTQRRQQQLSLGFKVSIGLSTLITPTFKPTYILPQKSC